MLVIEMPEDFFLSEDQAERIREQVRQTRERGETLVVPHGARVYETGENATSAKIERLLSLHDLTPEERGFVRAALSPESGKDFWAVLADYLEERDNPSAARFRKRTIEVE